MTYAPAYRPALGATAIDTPKPTAGRAQPPIWPLIVGNNGAYLAVRSSPAQGSCGVSGYPCRHPGVDVNGPRGTKVASPVDGTIVAAAAGSSPPWTGYGPWLVVVLGDDGKYQLLAHLDPSTAGMGPVGRRVRAGDQVGTVSSANHVHWEVRTKLTPPAGGNNFTNGTDPLAWMRARQIPWAPIALLGGGAILLYMLARSRGLVAI